MLSINELKISSGIDRKELLKLGFKTYNNNVFYITKSIYYNGTIILRMAIGLNDNSVGWDIIDNNTQRIYYPFWSDINGENDLVAAEVRSNFDDYINDLRAHKILEGE